MNAHANKKNSDFLLLHFVGRVHSWWLRNPIKSLIVLFVCAEIVNLGAIGLDIWNSFKCNKVDICAVCTGFGTGQWGWFFPFALPTASYLMYRFLKFISGAVISLDKIVEPKNKIDVYSNILSKRFAKGWKWLFRFLLALTICIVILADWKDIFSPIIGVNPDAHEPDWSNYGYLFGSMKDFSFLYLLFNISAFLMEGLLGYWGFLVLFGVFAINRSIIKDLSELEAERRAETTTHPRVSGKFRIKWDWDGLNGRGGLHEFDKVFAIYFILLFLALLFSSISITNQINKDELDVGGWVLTIGTFFLFVNTFSWLVWPYWNFFPQKHEKDEKEINKAPFGTKNIFWIIISTFLAAWGGVFFAVLKNSGAEMILFEILFSPFLK